MRSFFEHTLLVFLTPGSELLAAALVLFGALLTRRRASSTWAPNTEIRVGISLIVLVWGVGSALMWAFGGWSLWVRAASTLVTAAIVLPVIFARRHPGARRKLSTGAPLRRRSWRSFASRASIAMWTTCLAVLALLVLLSATSAGDQTYDVVALGAGSVVVVFGWPTGLAILGSVSVIAAVTIVTLRSIAVPPFSREPAQEARERVTASTQIVTITTAASALVLASVLQLMGQATGGRPAPGVAEFYDGQGQFPLSLVLIVLGWIIEVSALVALLIIGYHRMRHPDLRQAVNRSDVTGAS